MSARESMYYRHLGDTGLQVSEIALGSWLTYGETISFDHAKTCIHKAFDCGINFFDTADAYGQGEAEILLGKVLQTLPRTDLVISTKCFFPTSNSPNGRGLSRKHIIES